MTKELENEIQEQIKGKIQAEIENEIQEQIKGKK